MSRSCERETVVENLSSIDSMNRPMVHQQRLANHLPVRLVVVHSKTLIIWGSSFFCILLEIKNSFLHLFTFATKYVQVLPKELNWFEIDISNQPVKSCLLNVDDDRMSRVDVFEDFGRSRVLRRKPNRIPSLTEIAPGCRVRYRDPPSGREKLFLFLSFQILYIVRVFDDQT